MDETQRLAWRVGIVVICAALVLAILIVLFGEGWQSQYTVFVDTHTAPNVTKDTPVRKNGILIGRVYAVQNQERGVRLTLKIDSDEPLYENEICKIGTASFLGDAVIDIVPGTDPGRGEPIQDRMMFANVSVARNPIELIDVALKMEQNVADTLQSIKRAADTVDEAGKGLTQIVSRVQEAVGENEGDLQQFFANTRNLSEKANTALDNFNALMENVNALAGDETVRGNLSETIQKLPEIFNEITLAVADTRETINSFRKISDNADVNLNNLQKFTEALGEQGPEFLENLNTSLQQVDTLIAEVNAFAQGIGQSKGTIGKLLQDPELYNNLNETIRNIRDFSTRLEPLMNDIRYAVDGIARDPGQLGLRGALDRSPAFGKFKAPQTGMPNNRW